MMIPFRPTRAAVNIDVSSSSQRVALGPPNSLGALRVRVMNNGSATVWVEFGDSTVTAAVTTSHPVGAGVTEVFTVPMVSSAPYVAAIAAGSTGIIYFTPGEGI